MGAAAVVSKDEAAAGCGAAAGRMNAREDNATIANKAQAATAVHLLSAD